MAAVLLPQGKQQYMTATGAPLVGGKVYTYDTGTTTPRTTWADAAQATPNTNPVILDARGEALIFWSGAYRVVIKDSLDNTIWTVDGVADGVSSLRADLASTASASLGAGMVGFLASVAYADSTVGGFLYRAYGRTQGEITAGITPVNYFYPPYTVDRYGANSVPGTTDTNTFWTAAIAAAAAAGGATVTTVPGTTYYSTVAPVLKNGVVIDGAWSRLNLTLGTGDVFGIRVVTNSGVRRLRVYVTSAGVPSSQYIFHAPISVGAPYNNGDSPGSVNAFQTAYNWFIEDVELGNSRQYGPCIQLMGDVYGGTIRRVSIPDSATCSGVHADWGNVGTVSSAAIPATKTAFLANQCYTTHPHSITIDDVVCGTLSVAQSGDLAAHIVRLSACYGIKATNLNAESVTGNGYLHTGGDLGFEFAPTIDKQQACRGNTVSGLTISAMQNTGTRCGALIDTLADNVYREQFITSYVPLMDPLMFGDVTVSDCVFAGPSADTHYGVRVIQARGVNVLRNTVSKWTYGILVDEFTQDTLVEGNVVTANRKEGILVGLQQLREGTLRVRVKDNSVYGNGTDVASAGIRVTRGKTVWVDRNTIGQVGESTQTFGVLVDNVAGASADVRVDDNHCLGATSFAYGITGSTPVDALMYRVMSSFNNNTAAYLATIESGSLYLPLRTRLIGTSRAQEWLNPNTAAPSDGTWYRGDKIWQSAEVAAGALGHSVTTAGTFGTLAAITNGSTNATNTFTCGLTGITATTVQSAYSVTVSSATGLRAGMKCSIAAAGITDAYILSVSGLVIQLDTQANATQAGGALVTSGLVEGEVISINTTTPKSGAVVLKITGNSVTIDSALVDTQSGRTITYTTPVFKAWAAIAA
jgi:hypothetical protein